MVCQLSGTRRCGLSHIYRTLRQALSAGPRHVLACSGPYAIPLRRPRDPSNRYLHDESERAPSAKKPREIWGIKVKTRAQRRTEYIHDVLRRTITRSSHRTAQRHAMKNNRENGVVGDMFAQRAVSLETCPHMLTVHGAADLSS